MHPFVGEGKNLKLFSTLCLSNNIKLKPYVGKAKKLDNFKHLKDL